MKALSIGWDVGGWQGENHGFALMRMEAGKEPELIDQPQTFRIPNQQGESGGLFELEEIIAEVSKGKVDLHDYDKIVIAVDAPLGLPNSLKEFINASDCIVRRPDSEINNPLAYRQTERHIYNAFGKKPLSAPFGRLGTSMTVATTHARHWAKEDFVVIPQKGGEINQAKLIIESYPAILKENLGLKSRVESLLIEEPAKTNKHQLDALYCAFLGLIYAKRHNNSSPLENFELCGPETDDEWTFKEHAEEGWIYYVGSTK